MGEKSQLVQVQELFHLNQSFCLLGNSTLAHLGVYGKKYVDNGDDHDHSSQSHGNQPSCLCLPIPVALSMCKSFGRRSPPLKKDHGG